jgi:subtilisin family serine protease
MRPNAFATATGLVLALGIPAIAFAQDGGPYIPTVDLSGLRLPQPETVTGVAPELRTATGEVEVVVRLGGPPLAELHAADQVARSDPVRREQRKAQRQVLDQKQDTLVNGIRRHGGRPLARLTKAINAVVIRVDAGELDAIAKLPDVQGIRPVGRYTVHLGETVPYIGAAAVQQTGYDGSGISVAVLDSGIDYLHRNLGGSGDVDDYNANDPTRIEDGTFPTRKVVGGYDFVGSQWPFGDLAPDPDPLDERPHGGHGTHVADIIGGKSLDGHHVGVAPGVDLYAVKVCSSVSTACSGVALLQGMDFALDPNGDDDLSDRVAVINMSLGQSYGQRQDDLSAASANAVKLGVVVVASSGNDGDKPYVTGSPGSTPEVISVAQTQVPGAKLYVIEADGVGVGGSWQPWSVTPSDVSGSLQYGDGAGGNLIGCDSFDEGSLTGKIVLVDRGDCNISAKVSNVGAAGGLAAVIANE